MQDEMSSKSEGYIAGSTDESHSDSQPLCLQCLTPFTPFQHYCSKCGATVGNYTRYLPFVNIPFQVEFSAKVWKKFWRSDASTMSKIALFPIVLVIWGPLFIVGLPFELYRKFRNKKA